MQAVQKERFRHEYKHFINFSERVALRQRLRTVARPDGHAGETGTYRIRSLYFDNADDKVLLEKLEGINNREKFRLRYYNDDASFIRLEKKSKMNGLCSKQTEIVSHSQCNQLLQGNITWMRHSDKALFVELYSKMQYQQLKPKTVVDYMREPFVYDPGNVRITIDSDIRSGLYSQDFFNASLPTIAASSYGISILEIKFDAFLPDIIRDLVQIDNRRTAAFSKYAACRIYG